MNLDKIAEKIAALGIPGLVLLVAMITSGYYGAVAITVALATLGGPFGMLGGIAMLGLLVLISDAITKYGAETVFRKVISNLKQKGHTKKEVLKKIESYPISKELKLKIQDYIQALYIDDTVMTRIKGIDIKKIILSILVAVICLIGVFYIVYQPDAKSEYLALLIQKAEQGDPDAQNTLGIMYRRGQGVEQDYQEAVRWFTKAANQGNTDALFNLGRIHIEEKGVPNDLLSKDHSRLPLKFVDAPDWLNQEIKKRIDQVVRFGLEQLKKKPNSTETLHNHLDSHLKWLTDITVRTTADAIELSATYRKPVVMIRVDGTAFYIDKNLVALDYIPITNFKIVEVTGFRNTARPVPGQIWREDDIRAAIMLVKMLQVMDEGHERKLIYEIESIDVSNFSRRGENVSQLIIKTIDGPHVLWGAEPGQAAANREPSEQQKLAALYLIFRQRGTLKGDYKYIDLRVPRQ